MKDRISVLFVCIGNICRSPTAEAVFRQKAEKAGWGGMLKADSAGIAGYHIGEAPDRRAQQHAQGRGYNLSALRARQIRAEDFSRFDFILCMEKPVLDDVQRMAASLPGKKAEVALFLDYLPGHEGRDVPDPYYGGDDGFEQVLDLVEEGSDSLLRHLLKKQGVFGCGC
jgi:protein-tyrosine phosphatase